MPATDSKLVETIHETVKKLDNHGGTGGYVSLSHYAFDRVPCTRRKLYAIARKHAAEWGYEYKNSEYRASGNRPFQRNHKKGQTIPPGLFRRSAR